MQVQSDQVGDMLRVGWVTRVCSRQKSEYLSGQVITALLCIQQLLPQVLERLARLPLHIHDLHTDS